MKFQFNILYISAYLLITFTACTSTSSPINHEVNNRIGLLGEWTKMLNNNTNNVVHTLNFKEDLLTETMTRQNKSEVCGNGPELLKQYEWQEIEGTGTLILTVEQHIRCGDPNTTGKQLEVNYQLKDNTLQIFDSNWKRTR